MKSGIQFFLNSIARQGKLHSNHFKEDNCKIGCIFQIGHIELKSAARIVKDSRRDMGISYAEGSLNVVDNKVDLRSYKV